MTRGPLFGATACSGGAGGSATAIDGSERASVSADLMASFVESGSGAGSNRDRSRACRPATAFDCVNVRLSWTPRTALLSEIATLLSLLPPTPGRSGRPGRARPIHKTLANVAIAARPADSRVDRSLEAIEGRVGVCRLFSMSATAVLAVRDIGLPRFEGRPPSEGVGPRRTGKARPHNPLP
jgi:hypothetical protein